MASSGPARTIAIQGPTRPLNPRQLKRIQARRVERMKMAFLRGVAALNAEPTHEHATPPEEEN